MLVKFNLKHKRLVNFVFVESQGTVRQNRVGISPLNRIAGIICRQLTQTFEHSIMRMVTPQDSPMPHDDHLHLHGLSVSTRLGVPEEERALLQRVKINVTLFPIRPLTGLKDDFSQTINYAEVMNLIRQVGGARQRLLIETLAEEIIDALMSHFPLQEVRLELEKFILPDTDFVRVRMTKSLPLAS